MIFSYPIIFVATFTEFIEDLYHGEYPVHELRKLEKCLSANGCDLNSGSGTVKLDLLLLAVEEVRKIAAQQVSDSVYTAGDGSEFTSNKLMREERYKHLRLRRNPDEKYSVPVTTSMAVKTYIKNDPLSLLSSLFSVYKLLWTVCLFFSFFPFLNFPKK